MNRSHYFGVCMVMKSLLSFLLIAPLATCLCSCSGSQTSSSHVKNDPGGATVGGAPGSGGGTGAVSSNTETHASGALNGQAAANGDPVTGTGNLGSGSTQSDPISGSNQIGPAARF